ncbi:RsmB/NOP family class I SAM-dependent RNA methyltransferase [Actinomyces howellii]|uniref:Ribosomal RNA small subunit methyltransferase B n=1 Tax=Actinomyces howellii TaxID=52771 RepID=A0A448HE84_9ACTO|nr:transcription antitermination factor NusB [Actinomyces howellii]VEG26073.1 Ribosomal RNA small subunit methyltransferase B [Actinomyces howellii]
MGRGGHRGRGAGRADARRGPGADSRSRGAPDPARTVALETLTKVRRDDAFANLVLPALLDREGLSGRDAGFATALTYGTLRLQGRYDAVLTRCVDRPLEEVDGPVLDVLRLGAHQLLAMRVPRHAAVWATVDLAAHALGRGAASFVNAVLRRVSALYAQEWLDRLRREAPDATAALAQVESHPQWVVKAMRQALVSCGRGVEELPALLGADNVDPEVALCARPGLISPEALVKEAASALGGEPRPGATSPCAVVLTGGDPGRLASVRRGRAGVEDEGSQLVALLLAEAGLEGRDERWLDMCAGPGGKAALLGARAAQRGARLVATEIAPHRVRLLESAVRALPPGTVEVRQGDARDAGSQEPGAYDRVLLDAPCSGLGSLRRRPEARWRRRPADVTELAELQRELLASALRAVRRGGVVAYVTCSPHVLETSLVVGDVLKRLAREGLEAELLHAGDAATRVAPRPPAGAERQMLQLWPHLDGTDAMFCALLRRT